MSSCLIWANNCLCKWEISIFPPQGPFFSVLKSLLLISLDKLSSCRLFAHYGQGVHKENLGPLVNHRVQTEDLPLSMSRFWNWPMVFFLRREGQVGCNFYSLKITAFKFTLRRRKEMTIEHKLIFCKKLETETERYDLTYRINTTYTWFIDYGLSYEKASASWKAQRKVVFFSL